MAQPGDVSPTDPSDFTPGTSSRETMQAQHRVANDAIADINVNDMFARAQGITIMNAGNAFSANADRRDKIADHAMGKAMGT